MSSSRSPAINASRGFRLRTLLTVLLPFVLGLSATAGEIWSIGKRDGLTIEFAPMERANLSFRAGQSVAARDFAGHQSGSIGFDGKTKEKPYTVVFDLPEAPHGAYSLNLDLIYRSGAPRQIKIVVNDKTGIFPVEPSPKSSSDSDEANAMLLSRQELTVPIEASWLRKASNAVTIIPLGLGSLDYDALSFSSLAHRSPPQPRLRPSIYFKKKGAGLVQICELTLPFGAVLSNGVANVQVGGRKYQRRFHSSGYDFGILKEPIEIAALDRRTEAAIDLVVNGEERRWNETLDPVKRWKLYVCPKVHNDIGFTDLQPHVNELDNRNTDRALDIMEQFPFYKFNFETSWLVDNYLDCRPPKFQDRFFDLAKRNRATINALFLNLMTGVCSGEELYRAMYFTHRLHRERGSSFDYACLTDAPSHSWFLPTLLTDAGIKGFSNGSNQARAPILHFSSLNDDSPFWWEGMNGEKVLFWFARSYTQWKRLTGPDFLSSAANGEYLQSSVPQFLTRYLREEYKPDAVMVYGAYVDNAAIPKTGEAELIEQWNREYEYPKMVVASDAEYFSYIEKNFGKALKTYRGDCGAYWEDGVASSAAQTTLNRNTQQILPAAEIAHSLASLFQAKERFPGQDFARVWKNVMFYDEHTWGAHNSISQPDREFVKRQWEIKESYATHANLDARNLLARGFNRFAQNIAVDGDTVLAFNWQNWERTAPLEVEINGGQHLVEAASGKEIPLDTILEKDGWKKVRFLAQNIPAMGYKGYAIRSLPPSKAAPAGQIAPGNTIENSFYRLTVDLQTGGIKSLFDKSAGKELVDGYAGQKLNEYVYVTGGEGSRIFNLTFGTPPASLTLHRPNAAKIVESVKTPLGHRMVLQTSASNAPSIRIEYVLYDAIKRVDIANTVEKVATRRKEACYFAFPFASIKPSFEYQIQNGWCRPNEDQMPGACREWFTPQNLVHLRDGEFDIAWATPDAPLVCLTDINRGNWPSHLEIRNGHVFSYVMHNYWWTNYRAEQSGTLRFRYSITSGQNLDRPALARFDADIRTPVTAYPFVSSFSARVEGENRPLPSSGQSLLSLNDPNLQFVTMKAAEDGNGFIIRVREIAGRQGEARLQLPAAKIHEAWLCNGVEVDQRKLQVNNGTVALPYSPNRFVTIRVRQ